MADALTKAEIEAYERFQDEQAAAAAERESDPNSPETIYLEAFEEYTDPEGDGPPHIMKALAAVAAFFHDDDPEFRQDPYIDQNGESRHGSDVNNAQFNQKGIMGNLCQQAKWMLDREERRQHYLRKNAAKARYRHAESEIDTMELEAAELEYGRCKVVNIPLLEDFFTAAKTAYLAQFAEEWTPPVKKDTKATTEKLEDRFKHSERRRRL